MTKWNELLQALNQTFNTQAGATSTVKPVKRAFDNATQEHVIWLEYRVKSEVFESADFKDESAHQTESYIRRKRLIEAITRSALWNS